MPVLALTVLLVLGLSGCERQSLPTDEPIGAESALVVFTRTGGFASAYDWLVVSRDGTARRRGVSTEGTVPPDQLVRLRALLASEEFSNLKESYMNMNVSDAMTYTVRGPTGKKIGTNGGYPDVLEKVIHECEMLMASVR